MRLGADQPKALVSVHGESLLRHAVRGLLDSDVRHVVIAAPSDGIEQVRADIADFDAVDVVAGGAERTDSVRCALARVDQLVPDVTAVLVHDAARAFTPVSVIREVIRAVADGAAAVVPVLPVSDTVKEVDAAGVVSATVDRSRLRAVQTPQGFAVNVLREAYAHAGSDIATDDAGLVERIGKPVVTVPGHAHALKITTTFDLAIAETVLAEARS